MGESPLDTDKGSMILPYVLFEFTPPIVSVLGKFVCFEFTPPIVSVLGKFICFDHVLEP